ncbi:MAG: hypothetical protein WA005_18925 [Candidatus Binataceae bacterium]
MRGSALEVAVAAIEPAGGTTKPANVGQLAKAFRNPTVVVLNFDRYYFVSVKTTV